MVKARKAKKAKTEPEDTPEEVFHVEVVSKARVTESDNENAEPTWEYFVKWAGYDSDANTWEPQGHLNGCARLLESFWHNVGTDNNDYNIGYEVSADDNWIKKEKAFFAKNYRTIQAEQKRQVEEKKKQENSKKRKKAVSRERSKDASVVKRQKTPIGHVEDEPGSSSEDDLPLIQKKDVPLLITIPANSSKKRKHVLDSSSEDEPLQDAQKLRPQKMPKSKHRGDTELIQKSPLPEPSPNSLFSRSPSPELPPVNKMPFKNNERSTGSSAKPMRQPANPQAKIAQMQHIPLSNGIPTKQRLALGALAPTLPKDVQPSSQPALKPKLQLPSRTNSGNLANLSFKKKPAPTLSIPADSISRQDSTPVSAFRSPMPEHEPTLASLNSRSNLSPQIMTQTPSIMPAATFSDFGQTTIAPSMLSPSTVDEFLQSVMPKQLMTPLDSRINEQPAELVPPKPIRAARPALPTRNQKEWKWKGLLFINSTETPMCKVHIHHVTQENALSFSIAFQTLQQIQITSMYDMVDFHSISSIFQKPTQLGLLSPEGDEDTPPFNLLVHYMEKFQKVFLVPIILDDSIIGQTVFFPHAFHPQLNSELPLDLSNTGRGPLLVGAILPYTLTQAQLKDQFRPLSHKLGPPSQLVDDQSLHYYRHAMQILNFPKHLYDYIGDQKFKRTYSIWSGNSSKIRSRESLETRLLQTILDHAKATNAGSRSDARVVFVYVGALTTIHKLAQFVDRRTTTHVQFYTYGTHPSAPSSMWGVKEIWPCGGIVTFTPSAMRRDPIGMRNKIVQISRHPLWACYILPAALGSVARLECSNEDPVDLLDKHDHLMMQVILQAIEDGDVALLQAPPERGHCNHEDEAQWLKEFVTFTPPTQREALNRSITAFLQAQASKPGWTIESEITKDLSRMERHPAFVTQYRRYVVIQSDIEDESGNIHNDGFEWTTATKFDFKDQFFPNQMIGTN